MNKFLVSVLLFALFTLGSTECFVENCDNCYLDDPTKCQKCKPAFFINSANECKSCTSHCELCTTSTNCDRCEANYVRKTSLTGVTCVVSNCGVDNCDECVENDATKCKTCLPQFYLDKDAQCPSCSSNCTTCDSKSDYCTGCADYFHLNPSTHVCEPEICQVTNCAKCVAGDTSRCLKCSEGFYRNSESKCNACLSHCAFCEMSSTCERCEDHYELKKSVLGDQCLVKECQITYCDKCQTGEAYKCATCANQTFLGNDAKCYNCSKNCLSCTESENHCTSCPDYFQLNPSTHVCEPEICQIDNCAKCVAGNTLQCLTCNNGYYRNSEGKCNKCLSHCAFCQMSNTCERCDEHYKLHKSILGDQCIVGDCQVQYCEDCSTTDAKVCEKCIPQTYLEAKDSQCYNCSKNCLTCSGSDTNCTSCPDYFSLNPSTHQCEEEKCQVADCNQCVNHNTAQCLKCNDGFFPNSEKKCANCMSHCSLCETSFGCERCEEHYAVKRSVFGDKCVVKECQILYCATCEEEDAKKCAICANQTYLNSSDSKCYNCSENCFTCAGSADNCTSCYSHWNLNTESHRCEESDCIIDNCQKCADGHKGACEVCNPGFWLESSVSCQPCDQNCQKCAENAKKCTECAQNYTLNPSTNQCEATTCQVENCGTCDKLNTTVCASCKSDFFLSAGVCNSCTSGCQDCDNSDICKTCKSSYFKDANQKCQACPSNCKNCADNNNCTLCETTHGVNKTTGLCEKCPSNCTSCNYAGTCDLCEENLVFDESLISCTQPHSSKAWLWILLSFGIIGLLAFVYFKVIKPRLHKVKPSHTSYGLLEDGQSHGHNLSLVAH